MDILPAEQYRHHVSLIRGNRVRLLYIAPESLVRPNIMEMLQGVTVECIAIDEAHCISAWGHDFRPEYRHLARIRQKFPKAVCAAFTATATPAVQKDIRTSLGFSPNDGFRAFTGSFDRENLVIRVMFKDDPLQQTLAFLGSHAEDPGIIYCLSRKQVENLAEKLAGRGFSVRPYHAGHDEQRNRAARFHLDDMVRFAEAEDCRKKRLLAYFGETRELDHCGMCDNCLAPQEQVRDISIEARKFLSCVKRTGERFGAGHVIDVLRGAETKKIFRFRHNTLSTHGIGKDLSKKQWFYLSRQFQSKGFVRREEQYGGLSLTPAAWKVLKGETTVAGWLDPRHKFSGPTETAAGTESVESPSHHPDLFEQLRQKRKELADQGGIPPYAVFSDKTLVEMATYFPRTETDFLKTFGVGQTKLKKYGPAFISLIRDFCTTRDISDVPEKHFPTPAAADNSPTEKRRFQVARLYHEGLSVKNITDRFQVKQTTVLNHLYRYFQEGNRIESGHVIDECSLSSDLQQKALQAFDSLGYQFLKPVFDALDREIPYDELHVLRVYYLYANQ